MSKKEVFYQLSWSHYIGLASHFNVSVNEFKEAQEQFPWLRFSVPYKVVLTETTEPDEIVELVQELDGKLNNFQVYEFILDTGDYIRENDNRHVHDWSDSDFMDIYNERYVFCPPEQLIGDELDIEKLSDDICDEFGDEFFLRLLGGNEYLFYGDDVREYIVNRGWDESFIEFLF